jgi:hypothetical protein
MNGSLRGTRSQLTSNCSNRGTIEAIKPKRQGDEPHLSPEQPVEIDQAHDVRDSRHQKAPVSCSRRVGWRSQVDARVHQPWKIGGHEPRPAVDEPAGGLRSEKRMLHRVSALTELPVPARVDQDSVTAPEVRDRFGEITSPNRGEGRKVPQTCHARNASVLIEAHIAQAPAIVKQVAASIGMRPEVGSETESVDCITLGLK